MACYKGNLDIVKYLITCGADPNLIENGYNCLALAASRGHDEIVQYLLGNQVDSTPALFRAVRDGRSANICKVQKGRHKIIDMILTANPSAACAKDYLFKDITPLILAARIGHSEIVSRLIKSSAGKLTSSFDPHQMPMLLWREET